MSSITSSSSFQTLSEDLHVHSLTFLDNESLKVIAHTCKKLNRLSKDLQIWKPRTELDFGKFIAESAKQLNKSWKVTHDELSISKKTRLENLAKVQAALVKKNSTDDLQFRSSRAAAVLLGIPMPNPSKHYYPTGQTAFLGTRKITFFKATE